MGAFLKFSILLVNQRTIQKVKNSRSGKSKYSYFSFIGNQRQLLPIKTFKTA
jgi:hypothetical protein